jgi:WD40 repeat protein
MFFSNVLARAKFRKLILMGLAFLGVMVALALTRKTDPSDEEIPCITLEGFGKPVQALAFSSDGNTLATGDGWLTRAEEAKLNRTGEVKLWDVNAGTERVSIGEFPNAIQSLAFSPDGRTLAIGCFAGNVTLRDVLSKSSVVLKNSEASHYKVAFSPDGQILATCGSSSLQLRHLSTGDEQTIQGVVGPVAFCPGEHRLGIARFHNVTICDALKGHKLLTLAANTHLLWTVVFSPDARTVAAAAHDGTVTLWDADSGKERMTIPGHQDRVNAVVFSANGRMLASGSFDGSVKLWSVATGEELACLQGHTRAVMALAYAPDGQRIASGSYDQTVRIWRLDKVTKKIGR